MPDKPNILLVHGASGDASHWRHVIPVQLTTASPRPVWTFSGKCRAF